MRIYWELSPNTEIVPFNYQVALVGALHRWLGENDLHDEISLYSLSWLTGGQRRQGGLDFPGGSTFWLSTPDNQLLAEIMAGLQTGWHVRWGMEVQSVTLQKTPNFGESQRFFAQSPVLVKRRQEGEAADQYYYYNDDAADALLTETLRHKLRRAGRSEAVSVCFDRSYPKAKTRMVNYKGIKIRASSCPVIVSGDPAAVSFAWEVGVGNSTGIGFGALR
ncbi:MAG: CRISPR-associated endoribonuclease Cas6 [Phaeodactylibacter sp.]|nr:CRISPR-associated endoribonuclease Cas6 [Phaeodactylibacter sp.]